MNDLIKKIEQRFVSLNSVPCSDIRLTRDEWNLIRHSLADRIEREGIAPPDGYTVVQIQDPAVFTEWLCREMPAGTIIGDANWWAKRILRRFIPQAAAPKPEESP